MRTRCARVTFLGLILTVPFLIATLTPRGGAADPGPDQPTLASLRPAPGGPIFWAEVVVAAGLVYAGQERRRLLGRLGLRWSEPGSVAPWCAPGPDGA